MNTFLKIIALIPLFSFVIALAGCPRTEYVHVGSNWEALSRLDPGEAGFKVTGKVIPATAELGEPLRFEVRSEKPGRLWILSVDSDDELSLVFPNAQEEDNAIRGGRTVQVPAEDATWTIEAAEPLGESLVAFLVTDEDVVPEDILDRDADKAIRVVSGRRYWGVATKVMEVREP